MRISTPPDWLSTFLKLMEAKGAKALAIKPEMERLADSKSGYLHWTKFRHLEPWPGGITREEGWALVQISRQGSARSLPFLDKAEESVRVVVTDPLRAVLHRMDRRRPLITAGMPERPTSAQKEEMSSYTLKALIEEAHYSSVIEGAVSTLKDAQKMIREKRPATNKSEQMVLNNFWAGKKMVEWVRQPLSREMLLELQEILTKDTLEEEQDVGRFRTGPVQIWDNDSNELVFTPPDADSLEERMERLCAFANIEEPDEEFLHPVVKATLLHFQLAYDHPFADGNGRTARWLMLWFLLKRKEYWWVAMLSVSRMTQHTKEAYYASFQYAEEDRTDATYLVRHQVAALEAEMERFADFLARRQGLLVHARRRLRLEDDFNLRQLALFDDLSQNPSATYTQQGHASFHGVSQPTARRDLEDLVRSDLLVREEGRPVRYLPTARFRAAAGGY